MEKILTNNAIEEIINIRLPSTSEFQKCSFILPNGKFLKMVEHYEAYKFLVVEQLVPCVPDAEQLLAEFGWLRYSWIGYLTLPDIPLTDNQYKALETALLEISKWRSEISVQLNIDPRFYINYSLDDIPHIISKIKKYYQGFKLTE